MKNIKFHPVSALSVENVSSPGTVNGDTCSILLETINISVLCVSQNSSPWTTQKRHIEIHTVEHQNTVVWVVPVEEWCQQDLDSHSATAWWNTWSFILWRIHIIVLCVVNNSSTGIINRYTYTICTQNLVPCIYLKSCIVNIMQFLEFINKNKNNMTRDTSNLLSFFCIGVTIQLLDDLKGMGINLISQNYCSLYTSSWGSSS